MVCLRGIYLRGRTIDNQVTSNCEVLVNNSTSAVGDGYSVIFCLDVCYFNSRNVNCGCNVNCIWQTNGYRITSSTCFNLV